ncbi:SDR family oxidoreductase [Aceticella autotrophica]|uniref:SDR family oxidoreductase n=1 Tax=Aceticella autotrophica TaxID=2755338 RepID=A0A975AVV0_9THEO|nr:SDR family oxidoreductase [Aceticella autotrophica]QSZ27409.1 SDR family oxidoreductase [Aceticella autotrophica]
MLNGKVAIVTGGSGGIGQAICIELAKQGAAVAIIYNKNVETASRLKYYIKNDIGYAEIFKADVKIRNEINDIVEKIYKQYGRIDFLVNNAGIAHIKPFMDITESEWDNMIDVNLKSVFNFTQSVLKYMLSKKSGAIVNISSMWGIMGASCEVHYSASKGGVIAFTKALAKELGPSNIRVNCIAPGIIDTNMNKFLNNEDKKQLINDTPLMRLGKPEDIAKAVSFLLSNNALFITGHVLTVDGGFV